MTDFDVCIVGAGPVGLTLALDLARRGVSALLIDKQAHPGPWPKMERCNARSMEIFRRLEVADIIRERGQPAGQSMDVAVVRSLSAPPLAFLAYPTVAELSARIAETNDGSFPREPYQLISQYTLEPVLRQALTRYPEITTRFGVTVREFSEQDDRVLVYLEDTDGPREISAKYLIGCDGGSSTVRKQLEINLSGRGGIGKLRQIFFRSNSLLARLPIARARHYWFADGHRSAIIVQDDGKHFSLHSTLPEDADFAAEIRLLAGFDLDVEILNVAEWTMHLLLADSYGRGRIFIAGDAAHLVIPTGGLGMNTGVGDAIDLGWKLAATLQGWGGPGLLQSYEHERRAVGRRNVEASGFAAAGLEIWRRAWRPNIGDNDSDGEVTRTHVARLANFFQRRSHEMTGIELGYTYAGSPIICSEAQPYEESEFFRYAPTASPGSRFPHVWMKDGAALQDVIGQGFTLLKFSDVDTSSLEAAFHDRSVPLEVRRLDEPAAYQIAARKLVLLRPDLHVAWRGDEVPENPAAYAGKVAGFDIV